jgi:transcriptional regulator with XRE-family HTH domain
MIADFLQARRERLGKSRDDIAKALGITVSAVSAWERGEAVPVTVHLLGLAKELDVELDRLVQLAAKAAPVRRGGRSRKVA